MFIFKTDLAKNEWFSKDQASAPFKNRTKLTIQNPDMSGFRSPNVLIKIDEEHLLFQRITIK